MIMLCSTSFGITNKTWQSLSTEYITAKGYWSHPTNRFLSQNWITGIIKGVNAMNYELQIIGTVIKCSEVAFGYSYYIKTDLGVCYYDVQQQIHLISWQLYVRLCRFTMFTC